MKNKYFLILSKKYRKKNSSRRGSNPGLLRDRREKGNLFKLEVIIAAHGLSEEILIIDQNIGKPSC